MDIMMRHAKVVFPLILIAITTTLLGDAASYAPRKAAMSPVNPVKTILKVHNDSIAVQLDNATGQFNIGKQKGDVTLTYQYPEEPWSSWTCFVIDGTHYTNDISSPPNPIGSSRIGGGSAFYPFTIKANSGDSNYIFGGWKQSGLKIFQTLQPVYVDHDEFRDAFIFIKYEVINSDITAHNLGIILQLDTMIDSVDDARLRTIWGTGTVEQEWSGDSIPPWWFAYEHGPPQLPNSIVAMGLLDGFDAVPPNRFAVGSWLNFHPDGNWTYTVSDTPYYDSAVLYRWGLQTLAPGDTMIVATYYGLGHPYHSGNFGLMVDDVDVENCVYSPNPFNFYMMFTNELGSLDSVTAHLVLPPGLVSASGSTDTLMIDGEHLGTDSTAVMSWDIEIVSPPPADSGIWVYVTSKTVSDTFWPDTAYYLTIPYIGTPPEGELLSPFENAWTTCDNQNIILQFTSENGLDLPSDLEFDVDGSVINLTDTRLTLNNDTLGFVPSSPWADGDTIEWGLISAMDSKGCSLSAPVYGKFYTDLSPPIAENEYPANNSTVHTTNIPKIRVELYDVVREVDPASIQFSLDATTYTLSDAALSYVNDTLFFNPTVAGLAFENRDTICCEITSASDIEPDYCDPNEMEPYSWCFSINLISIWLPDTQLCPSGDTFAIPVYCEDLTGVGITNLNISVQFNENVLEFIDVETAGALCSSWPLSSHLTGNAVTVSGSGIELVGDGVLFYLRFYVPAVATEGSYSPLHFTNATFNSGVISPILTDGFATICFTPHIWSSQLILTAEQQNRTVLVFGSTPGGTDGYNPGLDAVSIPTPLGYVEGWFDIDDPAYPYIDRLTRDVRGMEPLPIIWTGHAGRPGTGRVEVKWHPTHFPYADITLIYTDDGIEKKVDMLRTDRCSFDDETDFTIIYDLPKTGRTELAVCEGWNLISFPFAPNITVPVADAISTALTPGYWYDNIEHRYIISDYIEAGKGYWVFCSEPDTFPIAGALVDYATVNLRSGWNMIGTPWHSAGAAPLGNMDVTPSVLVPGNIWGYDACGTMSYFTATEFEVGKGYWVLATGAGLLQIEGDTVMRKSSPLPEPEWWLPMTIDGKMVAIGLDNCASFAIDGYDRVIPPPNPDGGEVFGFSVGGYLLTRDVKPGEYAEFTLAAIGRKLEWNVELIPDGMNLILINGNNALNMRETNNAILSGKAKIVVERRLPRQVTLYSAVPNPFNPVTEIRFAVPNENWIILAIYDILGNRVATLADGRFAAGEHSLLWHGTDHTGRDMPSGIYFYRLYIPETDESITKSMVLLR